MGYFDIILFVVIASQNYRTLSFHYSCQKTPIYFFLIYLGKMSTWGFLLNSIEMKYSDSSKYEKSFFLNFLEWHKILCFTAIRFEIPLGDNTTSSCRNAGSCHHPIPQVGHWLGHTRRPGSPLVELTQWQCMGDLTRGTFGHYHCIGKHCTVGIQFL